MNQLWFGLASVALGATIQILTRLTHAGGPPDVYLLLTAIFLIVLGGVHMLRGTIRHWQPRPGSASKE